MGSDPWCIWLAGRITSWPGRLLRGSRERMRVSVCIETGLFASSRTRFLGQHAGDACLRSKQESLRQEGFGSAPSAEAERVPKTEVGPWISRHVEPTIITYLMWLYD
jgi:hypothetical protein